MFRHELLDQDAQLSVPIAADDVSDSKRETEFGLTNTTT